MDKKQQNKYEFLFNKKNKSQKLAFCMINMIENEYLLLFCL